MSAVGVDTSGRLAFCVKRTLLINVGRSYIGLTVVYEYALVCSLFFCIDGKEFDDLVSFPHRHYIFSPFSELEFWLV